MGKNLFSKNLFIEKQDKSKTCLIDLDAEQYTYNGLFTFNSINLDPLSSPPGNWERVHCFLQVEKFSINNDIRQTLTRYGSNEVWVRHCFDKIWTTWERNLNVSDVVVDLSSMTRTVLADGRLRISSRVAGDGVSFGDFQIAMEEVDNSMSILNTRVDNKVRTVLYEDEVIEDWDIGDYIFKPIIKKE